MAKMQKSSDQIDNGMAKSPLTRLSAELRNTIYELALWTPDGIVTTIGDENITTKHSDAYPLTQTCRLIRAETVAFYYTLNTNTIKFSDEDYVYCASSPRLQHCQLHPWLESCVQGSVPRELDQIMGDRDSRGNRKVVCHESAAAIGTDDDFTMWGDLESDGQSPRRMVSLTCE